MDQVSTLERIFSYKAEANDEILAAMRQFDDPSPAKEIAIRVLSHTYVVDRIFAANLRRRRARIHLAQHKPRAIAPRIVRGDQDKRSVVRRLRVTPG